VILAGVTVNFLFGIIAFAGVYSVMGIPTPINEARIEMVAPNTPAAEAGIPTNVKIVGLHTEFEDALRPEVIKVTTNEEVKAAIDARRGQKVVLITEGPCDKLSCGSDEQRFTVRVRTEAETPAGEGAVGIGFAQEVFIHYPWYEQVVRGVLVGIQQAVMFGLFILLSLGALVKDLVMSGRVPGEIAGPVGIVHQAQSQGLFNQGALMILNFTGLFSVNLAIMNLLPIPALDGGRAMFILLERVVGKHRVQRVEGYANYGGFILLIALILAITARDIWRIFF
jgi:regulator of sigma E protease